MQTLEKTLVGYSMTTFAQNSWMYSYSQGTTQPRTTERMNEHTTFHAGSISQFVAAVTALKLVSDGVLILDEPIDTLPVKGITLRQLLAHFSGLTDAEPFQTFAAPGNAFLFTNKNYDIIEQLIEYKTSRRFTDIVREYIFEPLSMMNSFYDIPLPSNFAPGYSQQLTEVAPNISSAAANGLWTSTYDLAKLAATIVQNMHNETVLQIDCKLIAQMFTPQFGYDWLGLGLFFEQGEASIMNTTNGYRAIISINPIEQSGFIAFTNYEMPFIQFHDIISQTIRN